MVRYVSIITVSVRCLKSRSAKINGTICIVSSHRPAVRKIGSAEIVDDMGTQSSRSPPIDQDYLESLDGEHHHVVRQALRCHCRVFK